jgi:ABC-type multidrug transport system ATPase subunit
MDQAADMLRRIRAELGITIIWVEHIMGVLMRVVDRVMVLDHGEKIAEGSPSRSLRRSARDRGLSRHRRRRGAGRRGRVPSRACLTLARCIDAGYGTFQALFGVAGGQRRRGGRP